MSDTYECLDCMAEFQSANPYYLGPHGCDEGDDCSLKGEAEYLCPDCAAAEGAHMEGMGFRRNSEGQWVR